jgi:hypothetical protein
MSTTTNSSQSISILTSMSDCFPSVRRINCLRVSHSRNNPICFTIDVAIHRLGFLCRPYQYGLSVEFNEMNSMNDFTGFADKSKDDNLDKNPKSDDVNSYRVWRHVLYICFCLLLGPDQHCTKYNANHQWHQQGQEGRQRLLYEDSNNAH